MTFTLQIRQIDFTENPIWAAYCKEIDASLLAGSHREAFDGLVEIILLKTPQLAPDWKPNPE